MIVNPSFISLYVKKDAATTKTAHVLLLQQHHFIILFFVLAFSHLLFLNWRNQHPLADH